MEPHSADIDRWMSLVPFGITDRMAAALHVFVRQRVPTFQHLFPYREMASVAEARMTVREGAVLGARWHRAPPPALRRAAQRHLAELASRAAAHIPLANAYVDIGLDWTCDPLDGRLLEFNPSASASSEDE